MFVIMPFYHATLHRGNTIKKVLVNYTFVLPDGKYENEIGPLKKQLFESIIPKREVSHYFLHGRNAEEIQSLLLKTLWESCDGDYIIFAWERNFGDDQPFFKGLGLVVDGKVIPNKPVTLSSLGMKVEGMFKEGISYGFGTKA
jgi:hypothetical protein